MLRIFRGKKSFDPKIPSYFCASCSSGCLINRATELGKKRGYNVYVLPSGSCVPKILNNNFYDGIVGVACSQELTIGGNYLKSLGREDKRFLLLKTVAPTRDLTLKPLKRPIDFRFGAYLFITSLRGPSLTKLNREFI